MTSAAPIPEVHFVGSVPYADTDTVFQTLATRLPGRVRRIPDGEVGERDNYIMWQMARFPKEIQHLIFHADESGVADDFTVTADMIGPTGYEDAAIASYPQFRRLREKGVIAARTRFQVSLPMPENVAYILVSHRYADQVHAIYEQRMLETVARIQAEIPADDLAIQLDLAYEMSLMEAAYGTQRDHPNLKPPPFPDVKATIVARVATMVRAIRPGVELGFHFCYGDYGHQHFIEPVDTQLLVDIINPVVAAASEFHPIAWVHLPVPQSRTDEAYFEPLQQLRIGDARPILGLIHPHDRDGTVRRIATARTVVPDLQFAVSTECGLGRISQEDLESFFDIADDITTPSA